MRLQLISKFVEMKAHCYTHMHCYAFDVSCKALNLFRWLFEEVEKNKQEAIRAAHSMLYAVVICYALQILQHTLHTKWNMMVVDVLGPECLTYLVLALLTANNRIHIEILYDCVCVSALSVSHFV